VPAETEGVYFRREDYASFWRRAFVDGIDFAVAAIIALILVLVISAIFDMSDWMAELIMLTAFAITFGYFVVLKRSRFRTVGYRLGGVRVVGLDGLPPGWGTMILRALFIFPGPINWLLDLTWLSTDRHRQALRDKFTRTYVIRSGASPIGKGRLVYRYYEVCGWNLLIREVAVDEAQGAVA
jgi:uncharacterized RDD family membrane protein YckC